MSALDTVVDPSVVVMRADTLRPATREGDVYYGLEPGTNGTATLSRRQCAELVHGEVGRFVWVRHNGLLPTGLLTYGTGADPNLDDEGEP